MENDSLPKTLRQLPNFGTSLGGLHHAKHGCRITIINITIINTQPLAKNIGRRCLQSLGRSPTAATCPTVGHGRDGRHSGVTRATRRQSHCPLFGSHGCYTILAIHLAVHCAVVASAIDGPELVVDVVIVIIFALGRHVANHETTSITIFRSQPRSNPPHGYLLASCRCSCARGTQPRTQTGPSASLARVGPSHAGGKPTPVVPQVHCPLHLLY